MQREGFMQQVGLIFSVEWNTEGGQADESGDNEDEELRCAKRGEGQTVNLKRFRKSIPDSRNKVIHIENSECVIFKEEQVDALGDQGVILP